MFKHCRKGKIFFLFACVFYLGALLEVGLSAKPEVSDLAVVLGNEVLKSGMPSDRLKARLDCALSAYQSHLARMILVSGGVGRSGFDEAVVMADYLMAHGVPADDILKDSEGVNTQATAINTAQIAHAKHFSRILIITQYYHIPRTTFAFQRAGLHLLSADYPRYFESYDILGLIREAIALPVYFAKMPHNN